MNFAERTIGNVVAKVRGSNLKARVVRGSLILATGTFAERGMRLVRNMILARLLAPEDFGLMAIVLSVLVVLESFTDIGVRQSIIHHQEGNKNEYLNIAWWIQVIRGVGLFIIALLVAPAICRFYDKPELLNLLRVSFLVVIFHGFTSPRLYLLDKEFRFTKALCLIQGSSLLGTAVAISLALYMQSVWVLVIGQVSQITVQCLLSHILCPFRPMLKIDRRYLKELFKFGRGMVGLSFLTVISMQTDVFVLAKLLPSEQVGMYALALSLAQQPVFLFARTIGRTLLPAIAEKQDDKRALCSAVVTILKSILLFGVPIVVLTALGAKTILSVIYGAKYGAVAVPFAILCFSMLFYVQAVVLSQIYMGIGMPHLHRRYVILLSGLVVCLMYPGIKWFGLAGAAGVLLFSHTVALFMQVIWMKSVIGLKFKDYIYCWWALPRTPIHKG
ncbi:MAG: lipopolysaccharide biosynthesis protein [Sedimentisphaerales bacterium]